MIENPADRKEKESKATVLKRKHDATIERKLITYENAKIRYANAQCSLTTAERQYKANPTKKTYRFWQTALIRALPIVLVVMLIGCDRNISCPVVGTTLNKTAFNHCVPVSGSSSHQARYQCYPKWSGNYFLITVDAEGKIQEWEWK